jgi:hypothetical protein
LHPIRRAPISTSCNRGRVFWDAFRFILVVEIPTLSFRDNVTVVGVPNPPPDFDGIACFRFLNRFTYGNFGDKNAFGLET